jgi:pimeloyl-ACP methyl ester carboxylesterase
VGTRVQGALRHMHAKVKPLHGGLFGDDGLVLVMGHGFMLNKTQWRPVLPMLAARCRCLLVDMPGFGQTPYNVCARGEEHESLALTLDTHGVDRAVVLGFSFSGPVAATFALSYPQRTAALVLVSSPIGEGGKKARDARHEERMRQISLIEHEGLSAWMDTVRWFNPPAVERERAAFLRDVVNRNDPVKVANLLRSWLDGEPLSPLAERLHDITCPTAVLVGERDAGFVPASLMLAEKIPTAERFVIPRAGHMAHLDAPEAFAETLFGFFEVHSLFD